MASDSLRKRRPCRTDKREISSLWQRPEEIKCFKNQSMKKGGLREIQFFKKAFEEISGIRDHSLGPCFRIPASKNRYLVSKQHRLIQILNSYPMDESNVIHLPSPWHAAILLESLQISLAKTGSRAVFRGQSNCSWGLEPAIKRQDVNKELEQLKCDLFCDIMEKMSFNSMWAIGLHYPKGGISFRMDKGIYKAAAQHYGIKTSLLDFTLDPAVAVYFASNCEKKAEGQTASVYTLLLSDIMDKGCELKLPPPFTKRLYTQRGIFIDVKNQRISNLIKKNIKFEIRFPLNDNNQPFNVIRNNAEIIDLLLPNEALDKVMTIVSKKIKSDLSGLDRRRDYNKFVKDSAYQLKETFTDIYKNVELIWLEYLDAYEDMLYWLVYGVTENGLILNDRVLYKIGEANKAITVTMINTYEWLSERPDTMFDDKKKDFVKRLISFMKQPLSESDLVKVNYFDI